MINKFIFAFFVGIFGTACSQNFNKEKLDQYFTTLDQNHKVMGSFAMAKDDQIIYKNSIGFSDVNSKKKADENTVYRIASITKTFTAVLLMKAMEEGKIKVEDRLNQYFPEIKNSAQITLENLLQHRSGIANYTADPDYYELNTQPISTENLLAKIAKGKSDFAPGSKYSYSNSNYTILALILEKMYGKTYGQLIQKKISKPLSLKFTKVGEKINPDNNVANSYIFLDQKYEKSPETDMSFALGSGNLVSTPTELLQFIIALQNGKIISPESFEKMKQFQENYGYGITVVPFNKQKGFGHNGRIDEFLSVLYYFPESKTGFAMITNQSSYDNNSISIAALNALNGIDFEIPSFKTINVPVQDLKKLEGTYFTDTMPLEIKIFVEDDLLRAQATGQSSFPLEAVSKNKFKFDAAKITMEFHPDNNSMIFEQGSAKLDFKRK